MDVSLGGLVSFGWLTLGFLGLMAVRQIGTLVLRLG